MLCYVVVSGYSPCESFGSSKMNRINSHPYSFSKTLSLGREEETPSAVREVENETLFIKAITRAAILMLLLCCCNRGVKNSAKGQ
jgi:hypothetical protein